VSMSSLNSKNGMSSMNGLMLASAYTSVSWESLGLYSPPPINPAFPLQQHESPARYILLLYLLFGSSTYDLIDYLIWAPRCAYVMFMTPASLSAFDVLKTLKPPATSLTWLKFLYCWKNFPRGKRIPACMVLLVTPRGYSTVGMGLRSPDTKVVEVTIGGLRNVA